MILRASLLCMMGLGLALPSYAFTSDAVGFPKSASEAKKAQFCVTISTAMHYASSYGNYVSRKNSHAGNNLSWVGTRAAPSEQLVELTGGPLTYNEAVSKAEKLELYWKDYGETYFANIVADGMVPFVSETGSKLSLAFMDCLNWQETIELNWAHPTEQVKFSFPGAPDMFTPKAATGNSGN